MFKQKFSIQKQWKIIYLPSQETMERNIMEKCRCLNVPNVEPKSQSQRRHGKWQDAQTSKEKECNWKSGYTNAQNAMLASAKCSVKRKSKQATAPQPRIHRMPMVLVVTL
jgi:hypothetical protein